MFHICSNITKEEFHDVLCVWIIYDRNTGLNNMKSYDIFIESQYKRPVTSIVNQRYIRSTSHGLSVTSVSLILDHNKYILNAPQSWNFSLCISVKIHSRNDGFLQFIVNKLIEPWTNDWKGEKWDVQRAYIDKCCEELKNKTSRKVNIIDSILEGEWNWLLNCESEYGTHSIIISFNSFSLAFYGYINLPTMGY